MKHKSTVAGFRLRRSIRLSIETQEARTKMTLMNKAELEAMEKELKIYAERDIDTLIAVLSKICMDKAEYFRLGEGG
jgi:hypothetical protein